MRWIRTCLVSLSVALILSAMSGCVSQETCKVAFYGQAFSSAAGSGEPNVRVSVQGKLSSAITDSDGAYLMPVIQMKPGSCVLKFEKAGFATVTKQVSVTTSGKLRIDASMFAASSGRALVDFEFTLTNDYQPGSWLGDYTIPEPSRVQAPVAVEAAAVVIYPRKGTQFAKSVGTLASLNAQVKESDPWMGYILADIPAGYDATGFASKLASMDWVEDAEPDYVCFPLASYEPDDFLWPIQWGPRMMSMHRAWEAGFFGEPIIIAVVDTGVWTQHPDLQGRCLPLLNSINTDPNDNDGHGTHVSGIIAASMDNDIGIAGSNRGALILPVKALEKTGYVTSGTMTSISRGVRMAADNGADVISMSLGWPLVYGDYAFRLLREALDYASGIGAALVAASGNDGSTSDISMPAKYEKCIAVSALTPFYEPASYANTGPGTDFFAAGGGSGVQSIVSTVPYFKSPKGYARMSGTSMATPHVSAAIGLLMSYGMSSDEAKETLLASAQYIEGEEAGLVNAHAAVAGARGSRAIFWLCDAVGNPLTYAFRGSDGSRDMVVYGDFSGDAWVCGWVNLSGGERPDYGDYFGSAPVHIGSGTSILPSMLRLEFVDWTDKAGMKVDHVPEVMEAR